MSVDVDYFCPSAYPVMIDPSLQYAWIDIPKCASSFIQKVLYDNNWRATCDPVLMDGIKRAPTIKKLVVLRDPVDRWISGFSECFSTDKSIIDLLDNQTFWRTIFCKNPVFDDHTEHQHKFVRNAVNVEYIYLNSSANAQQFYALLAAWIKKAGYTADFANWSDPINPKTNNQTKLDINNKLRVLLKDKNIYNNLKEIHSKDYTLFDTLTKFKT
jgi:hypothetical protein